MSEPMRYSDGTYPEDRPGEAERRSEPHPEPDPEPVRKDEAPEDFTHYVHLADGSVRKHKMTEPLGSHYPGRDDEEVHGGHFIIGTYPR